MPCRTPGPAPRGCADRRRVRRDRERSTATRRALGTAAMRPLSLPRLPRRRRRHVPARRAAEGRVVLGHFGRSRCASASTATRPHGLQRGQARSTSILRMHDVPPRCRLDPDLGGRPCELHRGAKAIVNMGAIDDDFAGASRVPAHADLFLDMRVPPTKPMGIARRAVLEFVRSLAGGSRTTGSRRGLRDRLPARDRGGPSARTRHRWVHAEEVGETPGRDVTRGSAMPPP